VPSVSIIVPIFNGSTFLPSFFESLIGALPEKSQLILVDDASTERVFDAVPQALGGEPIIRLRNDTNLGYSVAVNRGFRVATGDIVIQLNSDLILQPETLTAMIDLIDREKNVGIVGSKLVFPTNGLIQHVGLALGNYSMRHFYFELPSAHPLCVKTREVQITTGATVAMTRRVLDQLGPLDESYFNHHEDIDHCLRALQHGLRNFVCAESIAYHWQSQSGPARFARIDTADALFWTRWGNDHRPDLDSFVDEALDYVLRTRPHLEAVPFHILNLSRSADSPIILDRLARRWPGIEGRVRQFGQMNNPAERLWLPLLLPHWVVNEPTPFIYLVDRHRELEENVYWFESRQRVVADELIVDMSAAVLPTSELSHPHD